MISQALLIPTLSASSLSFKPSLVSVLKPHISIVDRHHKKLDKRKLRHGTCRAELSSDTSIGVAIGASVLYSLVFPIPPSPEDDEGESVIDSADARFAVMGIISFIPYFNWLSWLFAWLDTGKRRYAVYALVYLAPYLRPNLSISPEDSWLPIASIVLCIIHIQLEASLRNGDIQGLQLFGEFGKRLSSNGKNKDRISKEESKNDHKKLPSAREQSRNFIRDWGVPRKPFQDSKSLETEDEEVDDKKKTLGNRMLLFSRAFECKHLSCSRTIPSRGNHLMFTYLVVGLQVISRSTCSCEKGISSTSHRLDNLNEFLRFMDLVGCRAWMKMDFISFCFVRFVGVRVFLSLVDVNVQKE